MTREEAIKNIKEHCYFANLIPQAIEALDMAIKALEQESSGDLISRQAVLDIVDGYSESQSNVEDVTQNIISDIVVLPSVTPQPKTGHWIIIDDCEQFIAKCSECGRIEDSRMISKYPYCHCGARMIEPQERSDKE